MLTDDSRDYLKRVTVENRILLLLLDHIREQDSYSVPQAVTQGGMSDILSVRQNNLSRELQSLTTRGLLVSRSAHITGHQRRRKVYFLSQKGIEEVNGLAKELRKLFIIVRDQDGEVKEWQLGRLTDLLTDKLHRKVSLHEVVEDVVGGGEADLEKLLGRERKAPPSGAPMIRKFYGRSEELAMIREAFSREGPLLLSIVSIAGQGKTTLVSRFVSREELRCYWVKVNRWLTPMKLGSDLGSRLRELGFKAPMDLGTTDSPMDLHEEVDLLVDGLADTGLVLVLDDSHLVSDELASMIRLIRERSIAKRAPTRLVLASRERPRIYGRTEAQIRSDILEVQLEGLDRDSVSSFLLSKGIPKAFHEDYYTRTMGHPMSIALLSMKPESGVEEIGNALERMIEDEVLSKLGPEEMSVLELVSIMEVPVEKDILFTLDGVTRDTVIGLINKLLLREYDNGTVDLHDLVTDSVKPGISAENLMEYRRKAYDHFSKRGRDIDLIQTLHFALELKLMDEVIDLISDHGEYLLGKGYPQLVETVDLMSRQVRDPAARVRLLLLRSDSERIRGNLHNARKLLDEASEIALSVRAMKGTESRPYLLSKVLRRSAELKGIEGTGKEVLELYLKSLSLVESSGELEEMARVYTGTGMAYLGMREFDRSISHLKKALVLYKDMGNDRGIAEVRTDLGIVYYRKLELANSLRELLQAAKVSREGGFERSRHLAYYWTGRLYMTVMQPDEALPYFRSSLLGFGQAGDIMNTYRSLLGLVSAALKSGENRKAERAIMRMRREFRGGLRSILPWVRIDISSEVRSLEVHSEVMSAALKDRKDLMGHFIGAHLDHLRSEFEGTSILDAVSSFSWALSKHFKGPNMDYIDLLEKEAIRIDDTMSIISAMYARSTSTEIEMKQAKMILRKALSLCAKDDRDECRKKIVNYLSMRVIG
ncbi:MAG: hypothetical protein ACMUHM_03665 [Thermoplasmatota archaeon]